MRSASCGLSEIRITPTKCAYQTIDNVFGIGIVVRRNALATNEIHDFMFTLARDAGIGNDDLQLENVSVDK